MRGMGRSTAGSAPPPPSAAHAAGIGEDAITPGGAPVSQRLRGPAGDAVGVALALQACAAARALRGATAGGGVGGILGCTGTGGGTQGSGGGTGHSGLSCGGGTFGRGLAGSAAHRRCQLSSSPCSVPKQPKNQESHWNSIVEVAQWDSSQAWP